MRVLMRQVRGRKKHPNWTGIAKEAERTAREQVCKRIMGYAEKIVANWDHRPEFRCFVGISRGGLIIWVFPFGQNKRFWIWTSRGTSPHPIEPKNAPVLVFPSVYTPKTTPRGPSYGGPGTSSGELVFAAHVDHPGTRPRHFEEAWGRWAKRPFRREIENAMRRGARRA
jgi:hypothetical protein